MNTTKATSDFAVKSSIPKKGIADWTKIKNMPDMKKRHIKFVSLYQDFRSFQTTYQLLPSVMKKWKLCTRFQQRGLTPRLLTPLLCTRIRHQNHIKDFDTVIRQLSNPSMKNVSNLLMSLRFMSRLKLTICESPKFDDEGLLTLGKALQTFRFLKIFNLSFFGQQRIKARGFRGIMEGLNAHQQLHTLVLGVSEAPQTGNTEVEVIAEGIKNRKNLSMFHLDINSAQNISDAGLLPLVGALKTLNSLFSLRLTLYNSMQITDTGVGCLASSFGHIKALEKLHLNLTQLPKVTDKGVQILSESFKDAKLLSDIYLRFSACTVNEALYVFKGLEHTNVSKLNITLHGEDFFEEHHIGPYAEAFKKLNNLTTLQIRCHGKKIEAKGCAALFEALQYLNNLTSLYFHFSFNRQFQSDDMLAIVKGLLLLKMLADLELAFFFCPFGDAGLEMLSRELKNFPALTASKINFPKCNITDKGIETLYQDVKQLDSLTAFRFDFQYNDTISERALDKLYSLQCTKVEAFPPWVRTGIIIS